MDLATQQQRAAEHLAAYARWMDGVVAPAAEPKSIDQLAKWRAELASTRADLNNPSTARIALVGTTGAGKSSLLNAVLGQEVLPVGVMEPCTAFVTRVSRSEAKTYEATVRFCTLEEWDQELRGLQSVVGEGDTEGRDDERIDGKRVQDAAAKRIRAVYGEGVDLRAPIGSLFGELLPDEVARVFDGGACRTMRFDEAVKMMAYLKSLIRGSSKLWPLVREVSICGPYDCLRGGLELVDLPGLNDPNEARIQVTRDYLRSSPFVWVVFNMVRGLTEDIQRVLREEKLLQALVLAGNYGGLSLVGTKADDIDANVADQFGLPEDVKQEDLVVAYRKKTQDTVREQLTQMVRDLGATPGESATLQRMVEVARGMRVHTTSSNAYKQLKKIGRSNKDYGITEVLDTGIPAVHEHLAEIAAASGANLKAQQVVARLDRLGEEVCLYFRARAQPASSSITTAKHHIAGELDEFSRAVSTELQRATDRFAEKKKAFMERLAPLLAASVQGVRKVSGNWTGIHWGTLRAIVQRDGMFRSTNGRNYDLNEDIADPLLGQLPVAWERFFSDELGGVVDEFKVRVTEKGAGLCNVIRKIVLLTVGGDTALMEENLEWFRDKVRILVEDAQSRAFSTVQERRRELAGQVPDIALAEMLATYNACKLEHGAGMKQRMLGRLLPGAEKAARPIYDTVQRDLLQGLDELQNTIVGLLLQVTREAARQGETVAGNANVDAGRKLDPEIAQLIASVPGTSGAQQ